MAAPPQRWGWHQLASPWASRLVEDAGIARGDLVLDVGAGRGAITAPLVARGARVVAIERHPRRAGELRRQFQGDAVTVVVVDASDLRLPRRPFRVVANPPFAICAALLRRLTSPGSRLVRADLIVPWHVARRWTSRDAPGVGRWGSEFVASQGRALPRNAVSPPAPNGIAVLVVQRRR